MCETLRRETERVVAENRLTLPILYIESGLHEQPAKLRGELQARIDSLAAFDLLLLSFGQCGNALVGVKAPVTLIFPRVEDCISLLVGSSRKRQALAAACPTYFFTRGWLDGKRNLLNEYTYTIQKYGEARGNELFAEMLRGYARIGVLDTGAFDAAAVLAEAAPLAAALALRLERLPATTDYLRQLLTGPWPADRFTTIPPGHTVTEADLAL